MNIEIKDFLKQAASVRPSKRQLDWFDTEFYAFVHFSPNTYTDLEWGKGNEDPSIFNPTDLDCDEWAKAIKSAGMKGLVLTAKHHDGFCLWPSKHTEHCVRNSPFMGGNGDIVKSASEACRRGGIKFGFYLSPWDRNSKYYGTPSYNDYYRAQLKELLTQYGDIFMVWFDNACGEGTNGKKQVYEFESYIRLIREYQPDACIFNDFGPDVRWCGNEAGSARLAEWSVVPHELCHYSEPQTSGAPMKGDLSHMYATDNDMGALSNIMYAKALVFTGSEIDMSIRPGWFHHESEEPHSLERLMDTYMNSVGGNACFHLNIPPMKSGRFDPRDIARLKSLGDALHEAFSERIPAVIEKSGEIDSDTQCIYHVKLAEHRTVKYIVLSEDIAQGQRIETFVLQAKDDEGKWMSFYKGCCIGHKKICRVSLETGEFRLFVTSARDEVVLRDLAVY